MSSPTRKATSSVCYEASNPNEHVRDGTSGVTAGRYARPRGGVHTAYRERSGHHARESAPF